MLKKDSQNCFCLCWAQVGNICMLGIVNGPLENFKNHKNHSHPIKMSLHYHIQEVANQVNFKKINKHLHDKQFYYHIIELSWFELNWILHAWFVVPLKTYYSLKYFNYFSVDSFHT